MLEKDPLILYPLYSRGANFWRPKIRNSTDKPKIIRTRFKEKDFCVNLLVEKLI